MRFAAILWLAGAVWLNCAGWTLAALHQLNPAGYAVALLPGVCLALFWWKKNPPQFSPGKFARRFRRPLPAIFLFLAVLILLGGVFYAPANYDGLTYRLPRMLNWLLAGKWFWISTINARMNCANMTWEWMAMPLLALTHSDRALFLINVTGFLLMPGLLFSIFRQLGVAGRVAWNWMWLLPLAFGYVTQAGGIGNDLAGALFCLLSIFFGLHARRSKCVADVWLALLAAALMTGVKVSNAPLGLPCLVAVWPALPQLRRRLIGSLCVVGVACVISAVPTAVLNQIHTGNWTGDPHNQFQMEVKNPVAALLGNGLLVAEATVMPPVLPAAAKVNDWIVRKLPASCSALLKRDYPRFYLGKLNELPSEEGAGLGLGVALLLLAGVVLTGWQFARYRSYGRIRFRLSWVVLAAWFAGLVYMLKMGSEAAPRLMLPYYPLMLVPFLLLPGQVHLMRLRAGRILALLAALFILPGLILSPLRPLWPGRMVCEKLAAKHPGHAALERMASVYSAYACRNDVLAPLRDSLPADASVIGFIAGSNDTDYSLWRPFGQRKVIDLRADDAQFLKHPDQVKWLVVKEKSWPDFCNVPLADWAVANQFQVVASTNIVELVSWGPEQWTALHRRQ
jgi:hypothetical protein